MYHPRIVHLCNVKEVSPSKMILLNSLIYLFLCFVSWLHNILRVLLSKVGWNIGILTRGVIKIGVMWVVGGNIV